jgi:hypothetical protein
MISISVWGPTLKKCLLSDVGAENIYYNEQHFVIIQELVQVLKPLELAVKELSKNDTNLLTSEGEKVCTFPCSKKLGEMDSEIGNEMLVALRRRLSERHNKEMLSLMRFLQSSSISRCFIFF